MSWWLHRQAQGEVHIAPLVLDFYKHGERNLADTVCLVIFPLVWLMTDQVSILREWGVKAIVSGPETSKREKEASEGKFNLMFTSPEALFGSHRSSMLALKNKVQAVFINEVHCVVTWLAFFLIISISIMGFRPSSHLRTVYFTKRPTDSVGCQIVTSPSVFHANNMQIKLNIPQTEQVNSRLISGLCP